jgi:hypothetical protein
MSAVLLSRLSLWLHRKAPTVTHHISTQPKPEQHATKKARRCAPRTIAFFDLP